MIQSQAENSADRYLLTADNIRIGPELFFEDDYINAYVETWFDVDLRFGLNTSDTEDYVNVYANYYPTEDRLVVIYIIIRNDGSNDGEIEVKDLSDCERNLIIRLMNEKCKEENDGLDMAAAFEKFNEGY